MKPARPTGEPLAHYWAKRDFTVTSEPRGEHAKAGKALSFVIQKHAASRLHYDFRLELDGVLVSWAIPKGPTYDPKAKRLAIHVEDHPLSYGSFEGTIPPKQYGAGTVIVWDKGRWEPVGDPHEGLAKGKLLFNLQGQKMAGQWELIKIAKGHEKQEPWLLFKKRDGFARPQSEFDVVAALPDSVIAKPLPTPAHVVPGAVLAPLPEKLRPQLATLAAGPPTQGHWTYELKFDGYRLLTRIDKGQPALITRAGHDWSSKMPTLVSELKLLGLRSGWLDGEIVVLQDDGMPSFNALQKAFDQHLGADRIVYFLFDVPFLEGYDLRAAALKDRRQILKALLDEKGAEHVRFSADFEADAASMLSRACEMRMEGLIAKRSDAPYISARSDTWLKLKCKQRQEFVICGYTDRSDGLPQIGSLLLGVHGPEGELVSVGSVGTGWDAQEARALKARLAKLATSDAAFKMGSPKLGRWSRRRSGSERWVQPKLVAEVEFAEWTPDNQIRHASFISLRSDKPAKAIVRETAKVPSAGKRRPTGVAEVVATGSIAGRAAGGAMRGIKITHRERVIDSGAGLTKLDLIRYYESVAERMLPHLTGRPCALLRAPKGINGQMFFQRHLNKTGIPGITQLDPALWPGHQALLEVGSAEALLGAAQFNVIEFHTWNALARQLTKPDRMIFDLDPGEGAKWVEIQEAALLVRTMLTELGLQAWLKTSGGKGLHVVVPLSARYDADTVKGFSQAIVRHLAKAIPSRFVAKSGPSNRIGKIFVDYLRNGHSATTVAAFSARARPGLGVSMPVSWDDLASLKSAAQWTIATAREHLSFEQADPWAGYWTTRQALGPAMKALGFKPSAGYSK